MGNVFFYKILYNNFLRINVMFRKLISYKDITKRVIARISDCPERTSGHNCFLSDKLDCEYRIYSNRRCHRINAAIKLTPPSTLNFLIKTPGPPNDAAAISETLSCRIGRTTRQRDKLAGQIAGETTRSDTAKDPRGFELPRDQ